MASGKLPDDIFNDVKSAEKNLSILDAILKRKFLEKYNLKPYEVDKIPIMTLSIWDKIAILEKEKENLANLK